MADLLMLAQLEGSPRPGADQLGRRRCLVRPRRGRGAGALGGSPYPSPSAAPSRRRDRRCRDRAAERARQPGRQCGPLHARRRPRSRSPGTAPTTAAARSLSSTAARESPASICRASPSASIASTAAARASRAAPGFGLAIVKHVMQRHGGELDIDSEPGKGSTFRLVFPSLRVRLGSQPEPFSGLDEGVDARDRD